MLLNQFNPSKKVKSLMNKYHQIKIKLRDYPNCTHKKKLNNDLWDIQTEVVTLLFFSEECFK